MYDSTAANLLWQATTATQNAGGTFSASATQVTLPAGIYYLSWSATGTTGPTVATYNNAQTNIAGPANANGTRMGTAANGLSGGNCPASLGTLTANTGLGPATIIALEP